ncbi:MAG: S9 family peptidase [Gemmatimonadota bacterium]|nr:S9 family peptidase [Gemmatimonadota bacterium]
MKALATKYSRAVTSVITLMLICTAGRVGHAQSRPLDVDAFLSLDRVSDPQVSPDGQSIVYTVTATDLDNNSRSTDLWLTPIDGGASRRISDQRRGGRSGRWSPDGKTVAYVTTRGGTPQIRLHTVATRRSRGVTSLVNGADGIVWSPTGTHLAFVSDVYADCPDDACNRERADRAANALSQARVHDELLFRHWNRWEDGLRSHLFVLPIPRGLPVDVTAGADFDVPPPPFGGSSDYTFLADGQSLVFAAKRGTDQAWHTNVDLYRVGIEGGVQENLTSALGGAEAHPLPSPDGRLLAFLSQERAGFEADRWRLMVLDFRSNRVREVTRGFDRWVSEFLWLPDSREIVFTAQDRHRNAVFRMGMAGSPERILWWGNTSQISLAGDSLLVFVNDAIDRPGQVYVWDVRQRSEPRPLTTLNAEVLAGVTMQPAQEISWVGADGNTVHGMLVRPPQFRRGERYPLLVLIHGGPQGAWRDNFHSRWNAQMFAAGGYVTVLLNPRGSTGFGQRFIDQISQDWGGKVFIDIMSGVEHAARFRFVDSTRIAAAGGSYGGYMVNWINGNSTRFDALISHAGIFNIEAFYGATEELWFPEWEFGGPPWTNRTYYEQWSPHRFAQNFKTPTLVLHGALDYRVPDTQGLQMFTALRRQGIPSRLVYFPDEGHWISKPQNQRLWWTEIHTWLARYLQSGLTP